MSGSGYNGYVGFEPHNLDQLSKRLGSLAQTLASNLPQIASIITSQGGSIRGASNTAKWVGEARDDAEDISYRSRSAWELYRKGQSYRPPDFAGPVPGGLVWLDWAGTSKSGRQGHNDATTLDQGAKTSTKAELASAARSLANHKNDRNYLAEFWRTVDPGLVPKLARILHQIDSQNGEHPTRPLDDSGTKILADIASGLAAASRQKYKFPTDARNAVGNVEANVENPPSNDMWSSSMLFKYGPNGKQYDPTFLKLMGDKVLDWRQKYGKMPTADPVKGQVSISHGTWYSSLGILPELDGAWPGTYRAHHYSFYDWNKAAPTIAANDPGAAVLGRIGENSKASRTLLQDGNRAKEVVSPSWKIPQFSPVGADKGIDISNSAGRVVVAGTANRAKFPTETANAAANVFRAAASLRKGYPKPVDKVPGNLELNAALPAGLSRALGTMGTQYVTDLTYGLGSDGGATKADGSDVEVNETDLRTYLSLLAKDATALGIFRSGIDKEIARSTVTGLRKADRAPDELGLLGRLSGLTALAAANERYTQAELQDMAAARNLQLLNTTVGIATGAPLPETSGAKKVAVDWLKFLANQEGSQAGELFDPGHAAETEFSNEKNYDIASQSDRYAVGQGIYSALRSSDPTLKSLFHDYAVELPPKQIRHNGRLLLDTPDDISAFNKWFNSLPGRIIAADKSAQYGFMIATSDHKDQWYK